MEEKGEDVAADKISTEIAFVACFFPLLLFLEKKPHKKERLLLKFEHEITESHIGLVAARINFFYSIYSSLIAYLLLALTPVKQFSFTCLRLSSISSPHHYLKNPISTLLHCSESSRIMFQIENENRRRKMQ